MYCPPLLLIMTLAMLTLGRAFVTRMRISTAVAAATTTTTTSPRRALTMQASPPSPPAIKQMTVAQFDEILKSPEKRATYQIIDVREPNELQVARIAGTDVINLALGAAAEWSPKVEAGDLLEPTKPTICLCKVGMRSMRMAMFLTSSAGFTNVHNVDGGITKYANDIDPSIPLY